MKDALKLSGIIALLLATAAISPASLHAQTHDYVITNNDPPGVQNSATLFSVEKTGLHAVKTFDTGANGGGGGPFALNRLVVAKVGSQACLFVSDAGSSDVASFLIPSLAKVGNYTDPEGDSNGFGYSLGLAARAGYLFAAYGVTANIGVWQIGSGCALTLQGTYQAASMVAGIAVTPDGKTLVVGYGFGANQVDSFSIGSNGVLTEHGPYTSLNGAAGVDITADGKYAIFGDATGGPTQIEVYAILSGGTLGPVQSFGGDGSLGSGVDSSNAWLSPNERFLYVSNNLSQQVTSLGFTESPLGISFVGITTLANGSGIISIGGLTTVLPTGNGGGICVAEFTFPNGQVGFLRINSDGSTTEVSGSPFNNGTSSSLLSLAAFPPRRF